jgi:thiamine biosynthesis lipoprotein
LFACSAPQPNEQAIYGKTMGTTYTVKFVESQDNTIVLPALKAEIDDALIQVNALMSTYDPESELSLLNQAPADTPFPISEQTTLVLVEAIRLNKLSSGTLDVTVGPLVNLWGFGPDKRPETVPSPEELRAVRDFVGIDKFTLQDGIVTKQHESVYIDLSTIAKGYGVDVVADILAANEIDNYLVEIGGEMRVAGHKKNGAAWRVAIEKPSAGQREAQKIFSIGDNAIATSGDYRNYFEFDGKRYSHLIDPNTGYPIVHNLVSVTVVHPSSMTADGLATALNVMGPVKAKALAERNNLSVFMVQKEGDDFVEYASPSFEALLQSQQ